MAANELSTFVSTIEDDPGISQKQPTDIKSATMRDYQLVGMSWMLSRFKQSANVILGDEMGLGKTLQSIATMAHLRFVDVVVSPLTVVANWTNELATFCPKLKAVKYAGSTEERSTIREDIVRHIKSQPRSQWSDPEVEFDVLITTYELIIKDIEFLGKFKWRLLVVDEAHRLKNTNAVLYTSLKSMKFERTLLLTGTPIQNNLSELFALLHFIMPKQFKDLSKFLSWFSPLSEDGRKSKKLNDADLAKLETQLHACIRPFLLRRTKEQVLKDLPQKTEVILYSGLSTMQKNIYKSLLTKDESILSNNRSALMNIIMNLRKCCNHPYLFDDTEPMFDCEYQMGEHIIDNSGKMVLLDKLLKKLKKGSHKVLLFSQMTHMLDIIQDYLHFRNYSYERLDGSVRGDERYLAVKSFQDDDTFVFLLSTRAGGVGLNLTAADTVIFFDSDWNPQMDLQAQARVHRIGQKSEVKVIRLITHNTVEEIMIARALKKLKLTHTVLNRGHFALGIGDGSEDSGNKYKTSDDDGEFKLHDIIKFGLKQICADDESTITDDDIDSILKKGRVVDETEHLEKVEESIEHAVAAATNNPYFYDGKDYSDVNAADDETAFKQLLTSSDVEVGPSLARRRSSVGAGRIGDIQDDNDPDGRTQRRLERKRTYEEMSPEDVAARKLQKRLEKWEKAGYESLALTLTPESLESKSATGTPDAVPSADVSDDRSTLAIVDSEGDLDDLAAHLSAEDQVEKYLHLVNGDATKPQGPINQNAIVVNCLDNSGQWGHGGFFNAILSLNPQISDNYELAHKMGDLHLGDAHLFKALNRDDDHFLFVANLICQSRSKGSVSGIHMNHLQLGLQKIAVASKQHHATVHLPRIGAHLHSTNYYSIERMIRNCLASKGIETYIYYFPRGASAKKPQQPAQSALGRSPSFARAKSVGSMAAPSSPTSAALAPSKPAIIDDEMDVDVKPAPKVKGPFDGLRINIYNAGTQFMKLKQAIIKLGGVVDIVITGRTTHIVTNSAEIDQLLEINIQSYPTLPVVSGKWVLACAEQDALLPIAEYQLHRVLDM